MAKIMGIVKKKRRSFALSLAVLVLWSCGSADADIIVYTMTGTATGSFAGKDFVDQAFDIVVTGDTTALTTGNGGGFPYTLDATDSTVSITGFAEADFTNNGQMFANSGAFVFNVPGTVFFGGPAGSWDLITPIGPLAFGLFTVEGFSTFNNVSTSEGDLTFTSVSGGEMTASLPQSAPEPSSMSLLAIAGGAGAIGLGRRRKTFDRRAN